MSDAAIVIVRDRSSGRIHKRFRISGQAELAAFEADNADESGLADEITEAEAADAPQEALCRRCFSNTGFGVTNG
jgi:hypothetical protein